MLLKAPTITFLHSRQRGTTTVRIPCMLEHGDCHKSMSRDVHRVTTESITHLSTQILTQYKDLSSDELGELPVTYSMTVDPSIQPVVRPAYCFPGMIQDKDKTSGALTQAKHRCHTASHPVCRL